MQIQRKWGLLALLLSLWGLLSGEALARPDAHLGKFSAVRRSLIEPLTYYNNACPDCKHGMKNILREPAYIFAKHVDLPFYLPLGKGTNVHGRLIKGKQAILVNGNHAQRVYVPPKFDMLSLRKQDGKRLNLLTDYLPVFYNLSDLDGLVTHLSPAIPTTPGGPRSKEMRVLYTGGPYSRAKVLTLVTLQTIAGHETFGDKANQLDLLNEVVGLMKDWRRQGFDLGVSDADRDAYIHALVELMH